MKNDKKTLLAYLAVCFFWGSTYLAIRIGVKEFPPLLFAGVRFCIAGSIMVLYSKLKGYSFPDNKKEFINVSIVGLLMLLGGNGLVVIAEQWVHSGIASLLVATVPLFMAIIEIFILKKNKMDAKGMIGLILGFGGVIYLTLGDKSANVVDLKGICLLLLAAIFWSIGSVYSKSFKTKSVIVANIGIQMLAGGVGLLLIGTIAGEASRVQITLNGTLALLYLIVFGSIIGYSSYLYTLQKWPAAKAGTYAYVNPVVAILLGAIILNEPITFSVVISLVIIILGVILVQKSKIERVEEATDN